MALDTLFQNYGLNSDQFQFNGFSNLGLSVTANAGAITIALQTASGGTPGANDSVQASFRNATVTSGLPVSRTVNSALTLSLAGATTLGATSTIPTDVYVYWIDNSGTPLLGASLIRYPDYSVQSTSTSTASATVLYSSSAVANKPVRLIGKFIAVNTAGSWASPSEVMVVPRIDTVVSPWSTVTLTGSWVSNTTYAGVMRRLGNVMQLNGSVSVTGAPTSTALSITLPNSLQVDAAALPLGVDDFPIGWVRIRDAGTASYGGPVTVFTSTSIAVFAQGAGTAFATMNQVTEAIPMTWANGDYLMFSASIPILGWGN